MDMVTTKEALKILQVRGLDVPYPTLALWVREGRFKGAKLDESNPRGAVWYIPRKSVETFEPPERGRPAKPKAEETTDALNRAFRTATESAGPRKAPTGQKRAGNGHSGGRKGGKK